MGLLYTNIYLCTSSPGSLISCPWACRHTLAIPHTVGATCTLKDQRWNHAQKLLSPARHRCSTSRACRTPLILGGPATQTVPVWTNETANRHTDNTIRARSIMFPTSPHLLHCRNSTIEKQRYATAEPIHRGSRNRRIRWWELLVPVVQLAGYFSSRWDPEPTSILGGCWQMLWPWSFFRSLP